jgi:hypothetical protein
MLVHETAQLPENSEELHLLAAVPDGWLDDGREIRVEGAPTHFGKLDLHVTGLADGVRVKLSKPLERPPQRIALHLPRSRRLIEPIEGVQVVYREAQKQRWDWPTVLTKYEPIAPPLARRIPGLVDLPLESNLTAERAKMIDLSAVANTDPFTAPFGVKNAGKFIFSGMSVGRKTVAGVPFDLIDPNANKGRGLVVLHSPSAPAEARFPSEVAIPVRAQGSRLFFLGNVSGWGGNDAGTGEWGAVAEYVIHYADGEKQSVPLITGRTVEDWTAPPSATDLLCGLKGEPWHLNVLAVQLRPVVVEKIVFRDLGTPAAPLLAAVTMEKSPDHRRDACATPERGIIGGTPVPQPQRGRAGGSRPFRANGSPASS